MRDPPPEVVGSWPKPNYIDPETRGNGLFVVVLLFVLLCLVVVAARLYARIKILKAPGVDDVLIVISMVSLSSFNSLVSSCLEI